MNFKQLINYDPTLQILHSKEDVEVTTICNLENVEEKALVFLGDAKFLKRFLSISNLPKLHVILHESLKDQASALKDHYSLGLSTKPNVCMSLLSKPFYDLKVQKLNTWHDARQSGEAEIDPTAYIAQGVFLGEGVKIGANVKIHAGCVINGMAEIGEGSELYPNVTIYPFVKIGKNVRIHSGTTIGADGFGYNFDQGIHHKVWHFGGVEIGDHVEIGANSCVDAGTFSSTVIGAGSKLDNHVQIGHNCRLGLGVIVCGHVALGGSTSLGDYTVVGGKAGFGNGLTLGKACQVAGGALVNCDWPDGSVVAGHPARPLKEWLKGVAWLRKESLKISR